MLQRILILSAWLLAAPALALTLDAPLPDVAAEARAKAIFTQIRCVVCQSESIADSPADIAKDMRAEIRKQVAAGITDEAIIASLTERYGDMVLMRPPLNKNTALLWLAPLLLLVAGSGILRIYFRKNPRV
ncbi:MAG: cytochrome c-type biogenesis protein CcmH [Alphaproteobacteria bacterium]